MTVSLPMKFRFVWDRLIRDRSQPVPIKTIEDFKKTPFSYEQRIANENWTFDNKPRDAETGNETAPNNEFVLKYLILERELSGYHGMDLWQFIADFVNRREFTRILSIGSGPCAVEMEIAANFKRPYRVDCMDLNEGLIRQAAERAKSLGLNLHPWAADLNEVKFEEKYDIIMIVAALHHFVELEQIVMKINEGLADEGLFVTYEPVMRSGMFLYPLTRIVLGIIFMMLPRRLRVNHQDFPGEKRVDRFYNEYDRSGWTFESIRSGDIPDVLKKGFRTVHWGRGMTFLRRVSDSVYGANYDLTQRSDRLIANALCWVDRFCRATRLLRPEGLFFIGRKL